MPEHRYPSARGRQLARELRGLRAASGLTGEHVAKSLGWSTAKVSRIETGRTPITVADLRRVLQLYDVSDERAERLADLARTSRERGWWEAYSETLNESYATFIGLENESASKSCYRMSVIDGLLQTERYARAIAMTGRPYPPGEIERRVQIRLRRQERLKERDSFALWAVLDEAAIRRTIGGKEVMREQLQHLLTSADQTNITLQVLPFDAGAHSGLPGDFVILDFPYHEDPRIVFLEMINGQLIIEDEVDVFRHALVFNELREKALDFAQSQNFVAQLIEEI